MFRLLVLIPFRSSRRHRNPNPNFVHFDWIGACYGSRLRSGAPLILTFRSLMRDLSVRAGHGACGGGLGVCARGIGQWGPAGDIGAASGVPEGAFPQSDRSAAEACRRPMQAHRCQPPRSGNGKFAS